MSEETIPLAPRVANASSAESLASPNPDSEDASSSPRRPLLKTIAFQSTSLKLGAVSILSLLALWFVVTNTGLIEPLFLPPPQAVLARLFTTATTGFMDATLWEHLSASLQRVSLALLAAILVGVPLGVLMGVSRVFRGLFDPLIEFYRPVPPLAYLPLIVIWFGIGEVSKVLLIFLAILAPIVIATAQGIRGVSVSRIQAARSLGANDGQLLVHVLLPSAVPEILTGVRIGLGTGWSTLVAAELIAATKGLGFMVQSAAQFLVTDVVVLGILIIAIIAFGLELTLRFVQRKYSPWHGITD